MLPWNYGFHLDTGHIVFLGAFYTVLVVVATTLVNAFLRSRRDLQTSKVDHIRWHSDFHDLPAQDRACRHVFTGEFESRECPYSFDCRECETHAKLIQHHPAKEVDEEEIFGMSFPLDRLYHRGHTWARREEDGTVTVGLDDLGSRLLGTPDEIVLPPAGTKVEVNGTAFRVRKSDADVRVLSPVDGEVVETGGAAQGWYLKVRPSSSGELAFRHLLRGSEVRPWLLREMERLQLTLSAEGAPTLADGGVPLADMSAGCPKVDWDAVCGAMFLQG
ncbi:MAG TPA: glycine cleavage system protein H [Candidatus Sulfopaludibacter sp.]|jgi:glycine cleavage system H protein|nr:glycine cleavage system protein H [Candidatus Sulfopaludibacter sp.]